MTAVWKERVDQIAGVVPPEAQTEGMLAVERTASGLALDANAALLLKAGIAPVREDQLHRGRPLRFVATLHGMRVDAVLGAEKTVHAGDHGERRDGFQVVHDGRRVQRRVDDVRIHIVVGADVGAPDGRIPGRQVHTRLLQNGIEENVRLRDRGRGLEVGDEGDRAHRRRGRDRNGTRSARCRRACNGSLLQAWAS